MTGTIPSEIGHITGLASVSITNSSLTGTIPVEIGNLEGLRRLWLYSNSLTGEIPKQLQNLDQLQILELHDNDLRGSMPDGICTVIGGCDYEYKSLTSDCSSSRVKCGSDCCTECY